MDPRTRPRVPTSLQCEPWWVRWMDNWAPTSASPLPPQLGGMQREGGSRKSELTGTGPGEPASLIGARGPLGTWGVQHSAAEDVDSTRLRGVVENQWGQLAVSPTGQMLSGSCRPAPADWERPLPSHTGLVSVNSAGFCTSWELKYGPSAYTGPSVGSVAANQHNWTCSNFSLLIFFHGYLPR